VIELGTHCESPDLESVSVSGILIKSQRPAAGFRVCIICTPGAAPLSAARWRTRWGSRWEFRILESAGHCALRPAAVKLSEQVGAVLSVAPRDRGAETPLPIKLAEARLVEPPDGAFRIFRVGELDVLDRLGVPDD